MYRYLTIVHDASLFIYVLKVEDERPFGANVICFTIYQLWIKFSYTYLLLLLLHHDKLKLNLPTFVYRRLRGDMINVYKYLNKIYGTETSILPLEQSDRTRGHQMKVKKNHTNTNTRHFFFTQRVTEGWDKLPKEIIDAPSVDAFKNRLDHNFENQPVKYNYKALDNPVSPQMHYDDVIMTMLASQITSLPVVCSIVYSGVNQRKHQSSASLAFVREIHRGPVNFPHK